MKKFFVMISLTFAINIMCFSQGTININLSTFEKYIENKNGSVQQISTSKSQKIEGTSKLFEDWQKGTVKMTNGDLITVDSLNFDIYSNNILFSYNGKEYYVSDNNKIEFFQFNNQKFINLRNPSYPNSFFQILSDGETIKLLKLYKCSIVEGTPGNGIIDATNDKFTIMSDYYIYTAEQGIMKFSPSKKRVLDIMSDYRKEVESFIKKNRIKFRREDDLVKLFNYLSSLNTL